MKVIISDYLRHPPVLCGVFFVLLLGIRFEVLFLPPYWDSIVGLSAEATWLARNGFDYYRLVYDESGFGLGGPRLPYLSIYPAFQAVLINALNGSPALLLINHLLMFGFAASTLVSLYLFLSERLDHQAGLIGAILLMAHPMFLSQAGGINLEMPMLASTLLGLLLSVKKRYIAAAVLMIFAFLVKPTAIIGIATLFAFHIILWIRHDYRKIKLFIILGTGLLLLPLQLWLQSGFYEHASDTVVVFFKGSLKQALFDLPDFLVMYIVAGMFCCISTLYVLRYARHQSLGGYTLSRHGRHDLLMILFFIFFTGFYIHIVNILPRYLLYCLPVLLYFLITGLFISVKNPRLVIAVAAVLIVLFITNREGRFYKPVSGNDGFLLERSLEYLDDMQLNRQLIRHLESQYRNHTIVTSWPLVQMLTIPELGYVDRPFQVVTSDRPCLYAPTRPYTDEILNDEDAIWVYTPNSWSRRNTYYPEADHLISTVKIGERVAYIYRRTTW